MNIKLSPIKQVEVGKLKPHPKNDKFFRPDMGNDLKTLKDDIAAHGVLVPLIAKKDGTILCGHRRRVACIQLKVKTVPVQYVESKITAQEEEDLMLRDNLNRRHLSPDERKQLYYHIYHDFKDRILHHNKSGCGIDSKKIAERTGLNPKTIGYDMARLKRERIKEVNSNRVIQSTNDKAIEMYKRAVSKMLNLATVEQKITVDKFIEITKLATDRLNSIKLLMVAKK
ncbi:MAG: ParB N-terminal domain-containing protein [Spirochaetes bacterium]|nr:ParB N-terminal domain-containing protein [Spirochaetota bacterium]